MKKKTIEAPLNFGDYLICNHEKYDRAINGAMGSQGRLSGGVGKDATAETILAEYDKLGGLIMTKDGQKVATGSFYDFENRIARTDVKKAKKPNTGGLKITDDNVGDKPKKGRKVKIEE